MVRKRDDGAPDAHAAAHDHNLFSSEIRHNFRSFRAKRLP